LWIAQATLSGGFLHPYLNISFSLCNLGETDLHFPAILLAPLASHFYIYTIPNPSGLFPNHPAFSA
jgi:hypothetical protein